MRIVILFFLALLNFIFIECKSQILTENIDKIGANDKATVFGKVTMIDSTKTFFILHIQSKRKKYITTSFINYSCINNHNEKIKLNRKYSFQLRRVVRYIGSGIERGFESEIIDGKIIWNSAMKNTYFYENCDNLCGLKIKN